MPNARGPYVDNLCRGTFSSVLSAEEMTLIGVSAHWNAQPFEVAEDHSMQALVHRQKLHWECQLTDCSRSVLILGWRTVSLWLSADERSAWRGASMLIINDRYNGSPDCRTLWVLPPWSRCSTWQEYPCWRPRRYSNNSIFYLLVSCNFTQHVKIPTHRHGHTLDLIITLVNIPLNLIVTSSFIVTSDHYPILVSK